MNSYNQFFTFVLIYNFAAILAVNPILNVDKNIGYHGKIGEKNILVDLVPHLEIKNIDQINGICSYHVYKPNNEDFPFIIDIKDKYTGEAVIQVSLNEKTNQFNELNCKKEKLYNFFIEAHDCTEPKSYSSERIPVVIDVTDHNDHELKFDGSDYYAQLVEDTINEAILIVKARDDDCTNDGFACDYEIANNEDVPFKINKLGFISNTKALKKSDKPSYDLIVRAYDCLDLDSKFIETNVHIDIKEPCRPHWKSENNIVNANTAETQILNNLEMEPCNENSACTLDSYKTTVELDLNGFSSGCDSESCDDDKSKFEFLKNTNGDDSKTEPSIYKSFKNSDDENSIKTNFDGNFGTKFQLKVWIRRSHEAIHTDQKEHVFCGSDSELLNRHHYGLYFYRNNIKFLLRREKHIINAQENNNDEFYPSLWQWSLDSLEGDSKWHFYEIKYDYPNAALYIDGLHYEENQTNSDIIDAHELDDISATGLSVSYVGACYNGRSHAFSNHFHGDIAGLILNKAEKSKNCAKSCNEYLDLNMIGNENYLSSVKSNQNDLIRIQTKTYFDLVTLLKKINYVNKDLDPSKLLAKSQIGKRYLKLKTEMICFKNPENSTDDRKVSTVFHDFQIDLNVKKPKQEINVQIDGSRQYVVSKNVLLNKGINLFKEISISKTAINEVNAVSSVESQENYVDSSSSTEDGDDIYFSSCSIKLLPSNNNEKFAIGAFNDDEIFSVTDEFKLSRSGDLVKVEGLNSIKIYESYLKNLIYTVVVDDKQPGNNKLFYLSCLRNEPAIETNTILIQLNITNDKDYVAFKKIQKFTAQDHIIENKVFDLSSGSAFKASNPVIVIAIVLCSGLLAFIIVFSAIRMSRGRRRPALQTNEENPIPEDLQWDDSMGLNIIENPLETLDGSPPIPRTSSYADDDFLNDEDEDLEDDTFYKQVLDDDPEKIIIEKELEWDDTTVGTLEINENKMKRTKEHGKNSSNV